MEIKTYRQIESFNGVRIFELGEVEYPFREFVEKRGVDIRAVESHFDRLFDRHDVPYHPQQVLPLLPSTFEYSRFSEVQRIENGIVFSESLDALMAFSREHLTQVDHPKSITEQFNEESSIGLREKSQFIRQLQNENGTRNIPYNAQPLVYLPNPQEQQKRTRSGKDMTANFYVEELEDKSWIIFKYKTVNELLRNPRRFQKKSINKKSINGDDVEFVDLKISDLQPLYANKQEVVFFDEDKESVPKTWNFVAGLEERKLNRQYIWDYEDRSGTALSAGELPVELCEAFEQDGQQVVAPEEFSLEAPMRFLEPRGFIGGDFNRLRELKSVCLPEREDLIEADSLFADLLEKSIFVRDVRQPLNFNSLYEWKLKKERDEKLKQSSALEVVKRFGLTKDELPQLNQYSTDELAEMSLERFLELTGLSFRELKDASRKISTRRDLASPTLYDTKLLAYVLQKTQQSIYHPDQPSAGFECMEIRFESDDIWYALCEAKYHEN